MKLTANLKNAARTALDWRLLLVWLGALLLPLLLLALPFWSVMSANLDRSVHAAQLAQQLDLVAMTDLLADLRRNGSALASGGIAALALTLLLSPLLTGAAITVARARHSAAGANSAAATGAANAAMRSGLAQARAAAAASGKLPLRDLFLGGVAEYPRMFRMLLWGLLLLAVASAAGGALLDAADEHAQEVILVSDAQPWRYAAMAGALLLLALVNATLDAGRAELAIDRRRTSAVKAWWRGLKLLLRRPAAVLGIYAVVTLAGALLTAALSVARLNIAGAGALLLAAGVSLTLLTTLVLAWMRATRLFALMTLAASEKAMQHSQIVH